MIVSTVKNELSLHDEQVSTVLIILEEALASGEPISTVELAEQIVEAIEDDVFLETGK